MHEYKYVNKFEFKKKNIVHSLVKLNVSFFTGPPGPPGGLVVTSVNDTSVELRWSRGYDNHSPIGKYVILGRSSQTQDWKRMRTGEVMGYFVA